VLLGAGPAVAHTLQVRDETQSEADKPTKTHGEKKEVVVRNTGGGGDRQPFCQSLTQALRVE